MSHRLITSVFASALFVSSPLMAQTPPPSRPSPSIEAPPQTPPPPAPPAPPAAQGQRPGAPNPPTPPPAAPPPPREAPSAFQNIKLEIVLTDTSESAKKTVTLIAVDNRSGRIRSNGRDSAMLNVDARPWRTQDGRIAVDLTIQYHPKDSDKGSSAMIDETMTVALTEGKPMLVSTASDASGDRKVTVELTATTIR